MPVDEKPARRDWPLWAVYAVCFLLGCGFHVLLMYLSDPTELEGPGGGSGGIDSGRVWTLLVGSVYMPILYSGVFLWIAMLVGILRRGVWPGRPEKPAGR